MNTIENIPSDNIKSMDLLGYEIEKACGIKPDWTKDTHNNKFGWVHLPNPDKLLPLAKIMADQKARLATITAYAEERDDQDKKRAIAYHFILNNAIFNISLRIYHPETMEKLAVPSITPYFRNADWNEREFNEMFNIDIIDHPNPKRLFLDERLDAGIMSSLIPFSNMIHGAGSRDLWEKVMAEKSGYEKRDQQEAVIVEPEFTPVSATEEKPQG